MHAACEKLQSNSLQGSFACYCCCMALTKHAHDCHVGQLIHLLLQRSVACLTSVESLLAPEVESYTLEAHAFCLHTASVLCLHASTRHGVWHPHRGGGSVGQHSFYVQAKSQTPTMPERAGMMWSKLRAVRYLHMMHHDFPAGPRMKQMSNEMLAAKTLLKQRGD